jgi:hypothetical protein
MVFQVTGHSIHDLVTLDRIRSVTVTIRAAINAQHGGLVLPPASISHLVLAMFAVSKTGGA